jgi:hypothetical protein
MGAEEDNPLRIENAEAIFDFLDELQLFRSHEFLLQNGYRRRIVSIDKFAPSVNSIKSWGERRMAVRSCGCLL